MGSLMAHSIAPGSGTTFNKLEIQMKYSRHLVFLVVILPLLAACTVRLIPASTATPTVDPGIYNQVPDTTVFEPGQCQAVLDAAAPAYTSSTLGGQPSGEIPAGEYAVGVAADYGSSLWYGLNDVGTANYINSTSVASLTGACASSNP
jgi:hypothetical protein